MTPASPPVPGAPQRPRPPSEGPAARSPAPVAQQARGPLVGAAALGVLALGGFVALAGYFVRSEAGQVADEKLRWAVGVPADTKRLLNAGLDLVSIPHIVLVLGALILIGLARRRVVLSLVAAGFVAGAIVLSQLLKYVLVQRPDLGHPPGNSLPSGHVTVLTSCVVAAILVSAPRWRGLLVLAGSVVAGFAGIAVVINSWHRVSDVAAAYCLCAFWAAASAVVALLVQRARHLEGPRVAGVRRFLQYVLYATLGCGAVAVFLRSEGMTVAQTWGTADWGVRALALVFGSCIILMACVATLADHLGNGAPAEAIDNFGAAEGHPGAGIGLPS